MLRKPEVFEGHDKEKGVFRTNMPEQHILMSIALCKAFTWGGSSSLSSAATAQSCAEAPGIAFRARLWTNKKIIALWWYLLNFHEGNRKAKRNKWVWFCPSLKPAKKMSFVSYLEYEQLNVLWIYSSKKKIGES